MRDASDRECIWGALRYEVSQSKTFSDAEWALSPERIARLEAVQKKFQPDSPSSRLKWLFTDSPLHLGGRTGDYQSQMEAANNAYIAAVREVFETSGMGGIIEFVEQVGRPRDVGIALQKSELMGEREDEVLRTYLASENKPYGLFAKGFFEGCISKMGHAWAEARISGEVGGWTSAQRAVMLFFMPWERRTWDLAERTNADVESLYWKSIRPLLAKESSEIEYAVRKLLLFGRPTAAIDLLAYQIQGKPVPATTVILETLERAMATQGEEQSNNMTAYNVGQLLDLVEAADDLDLSRVASIEWAYLPLFRYDQRSPRILYRELSSNPSFFVDVLKMLFRSEGEERRPLSEQDNSLVTRGYDLLNSWRPVVGHEGDMDQEQLLVWVKEARGLAASVGLGSICDVMIGEALSGPTEGKDGAWPPEAVRAVIEEVGSADLESGIHTGRYNSRGAFSRGLNEGGVQEAKLAEMYEGYSRKMTDKWPRTASLLRRFASSYRIEARGVDQETELRSDLDR